MKYETAVICIFFAIVVYLFYVMVFGILHGLKGILIWSFAAVVLLVFAKLVAS